MSPKMPPDGLPKPKEFLIAGLPRPEAGLRSQVGSVSDIAAFVSTPPESIAGIGTLKNALTVVDDDGRPLLVVFRRSDAYTTSPSTQTFFGNLIGEAERTSNGLLAYRQAGFGSNGHERRRPVALESTNRLATFDLSVAVKGLDESLFEGRDALFMSSALYVDLALVLQTTTHDGRVTNQSLSSKIWVWTIPIPLDMPVLGAYQELARKAGLFSGSPLERTDLLCAATAIAYDSALYTTHPEDYEGLGIRTIEYGPVRNKVAAKQQEAERKRRDAAAQERKEANAQPLAAAPPSGPQPPYLDPSSEAADRAFRTLFRKGEPFGEEAVAALLEAARVGNDLTGAIAVTLDDADGDDPSWRLGLLGMAADYDRALNPNSVYRGNLVSSTLNVLNTEHGPDKDSLRIRELAFLALAAWGTWPDDASDDILIDLESEPTDAKLLDYYRSYMLMAGISPEVADRELDEIRAGRVQPTRARIEELRAG